MEKKNLRRLSILVTAQTAANLERLTQIDRQASIGRTVDKLVRGEGAEPAPAAQLVGQSLSGPV